MMRFLKKNKRWVVSAIFIAYLIHIVPVYLIKNSYVNLDPQPEEFTYLMLK